MKKQFFTVRFLCRSAGIAAIYVLLTFLSAAMGLSSGAIQVRFSEALCILPIFMAEAIPGLTIGCLLANLLTGSVMLDVVFGTFATLIGAVGTYALRKFRVAAFLPPILSNMLILPPVLKLAYGIKDSYWFLVGTIGAGEIISIGIIGFFIYTALKKKKF